MTLLLLRTLSATFRIMANLLDRIVSLVAGFQAREAELTQQLAAALADDAADDAAVAAAQAAATAAGERAASAEALAQQLQASGEDNAAQLAAIGQFLDSLESDPEPAPEV